MHARGSRAGPAPAHVAALGAAVCLVAGLPAGAPAQLPATKTLRGAPVLRHGSCRIVIDPPLYSNGRYRGAARPFRCSNAHGMNVWFGVLWSRDRWFIRERVGYEGLRGQDGADFYSGPITARACGLVATVVELRYKNAPVTIAHGPAKRSVGC